MTHVVSVTQSPAATVTTIDDPTSVDTALTNALVSTVQSTATVGVSPYTIIGGVGGSPAYSLAAAVSAGATTVTLDQSLSLGTRAIVAFGAGTTSCEVRKVTAASGTGITINTAFLNAHSSGGQVVVVQGDGIPLSYYGAKGDNSTDDRAAIQAAFDDQIKCPGMWLTGQGLQYVTDGPLIGRDNNTRLRNIQQLTAKSTYAPVYPDTAHFMSAGGNKVTFTGSASTDKLSAAGMDIGGNGNSIMLVPGGSLPGGLTHHRMYYVRDFVSVTDFKVSETYGGAAVNITTDGSGTLYSKVGWIHTTRLYLDDVYLYGNNVAGLNGIWLSGQQPGQWHKVRTDNYLGVGITISGSQDYEMKNIETIHCGVGVELTNNSSIIKFDCINAEFCTTGLLLSLGNYANTGNYGHEFHGMHFENNTTHVDVEHGVSILFEGWIAMNAGSTGILVHSADVGGSSYHIPNLRFYAIGVSDDAINDTLRGYTVVKADLTTQQILTNFTQEDGVTGKTLWGSRRPQQMFMGATSVADGGTITHGVGTTPTYVIVTPRISGEFVSVTARSSTTFTVAIKKHDNTAGTTQTVDWLAMI